MRTCWGTMIVKTRSLGESRSMLDCFTAGRDSETTRSLSFIGGSRWRSWLRAQRSASYGCAHWGKSRLGMEKGAYAHAGTEERGRFLSGAKDLVVSDRQGVRIVEQV